MKTMTSFLILFFFLACSKDANDSAYLKEYEAYKSPINTIIDGIDNTAVDSVNPILDDYLKDIMPMSCTWCVTEGEAFEPVAEIVTNHPEYLALVLDRALMGTRLTWGFRVLFKDLYPETYKELLDEAGIQLIPEDELKNEDERWKNKSNEYSLPLETLVEAYLKIAQT